MEINLTAGIGHDNGMGERLLLLRPLDAERQLHSILRIDHLGVVDREHHIVAAHGQVESCVLRKMLVAGNRYRLGGCSG